MPVEASSLFTETEGQLRKRVDDKDDRDDSEDYAVDVDAGKRWRRSLVARRALSFRVVPSDLVPSVKLGIVSGRLYPGKRFTSSAH